MIMGKIDIKTFMSDESVCSKECVESCKSSNMCGLNDSTDMKSMIKLEPLKRKNVTLESMKDQDEGMTNGLNGLDGKEPMTKVREPMKSVETLLNRRSSAEALKGRDSDNR